MKISIISITKDNGPRLALTVASVRAQRLPAGVEVEHIIVDSGCEGSPEVESARRRGSIVVRTAPAGVYSAINTGLHHATGDIVGLVHGADAFYDSDVLARVAAAFGAPEAPDFIYGDVVFGDPSRPGRFGRYYSGAAFTPQSLLQGFAPPHPSLFITREAMLRAGDYRTDLAIAGDFDMFVRLFSPTLGLRWKYIPGASVMMSKGGLSSGFITRLFRNTSEIHRALRDNGLPHSYLRILTRFSKKIFPRND